MTVGSPQLIDKEPYHSATNQPGTNQYTQKDDVLRTKKNQSIDDVSNYSGTGKVEARNAVDATRNYYKKKNK